MPRQILCFVALAAALLVPAGAGAVVRTQSEYPFDQVWNAAVRLVRVDLGFEVTERDTEGGFILFKYRGDMGGTFNASLEIVRPPPDGKVGLVIQIPEMPRYTELWLLDRLARKLRDEYGAPPPRIRRPATPTPPARGTGDRPGQGEGGSAGGARTGSSRGRRPPATR